MVRFLVECGADLSLPDYKGRDAWTLAGRDRPHRPGRAHSEVSSSVRLLQTAAPRPLLGEPEEHVAERRVDDADRELAAEKPGHIGQ